MACFLVSAAEAVVTEVAVKAAEKKEKEMQSAMDAHADMEWPGFPRLNPVNRESADAAAMGETVTSQRKDEIGEMIYDADLTGPIALVIGGEHEGIGRLVKEHCDRTVRLPMQGHITSLNASVAAGISVYEIVRQRREAGNA